MEIKRINAGSDKGEIFVGRELCQIPLIPLVVVIRHIIVNDRLYLIKRGIARQVNQIFHMPEEALLWRIVPAVSFAGHRAAKLVVFNEFNKFAAGIMAALVAVDHSLCMERDAMFPHQNIHRVQHKVNIQGWTEGIGKHLLCIGVHDHTEVEERPTPGDISNVREEHKPGP